MPQEMFLEVQQEKSKRKVSNLIFNKSRNGYKRIGLNKNFMKKNKHI